jgi:signal transduction histidine kinase
MLITDLLDVTRSQNGKLNLHRETFKIDQLIKEVVENMQLTTKKHTLIIKGEAAVAITADRDRISQVLINFLSNAIKYSPHSKRIIVRAVHKKQEIFVSVQDFGIGIPTNKLEQIFERFNRVSGPQMETFAGLGLGLYISAQIISRHGGKIWVESKENKGSTFYFSLSCKSG